MSIDDFASHLGVSRRGVAAWSRRGGARLRWDVQRKLDDALAAAPAAVRQRLALALGAPDSPAQAPMTGRWPEAAPRPSPLPGKVPTAAERAGAAGGQRAGSAGGQGGAAAEVVAALSELLVPAPRACGGSRLR